MANVSPNDKPSRTRSLFRAASLRASPAHSSRVSDVLEQNDTPRRSGFRKARQLSRVLTDMSFLDSLVGRKNVDDLRARRPSLSRRPSTAHTHKPAMSDAQKISFSLDRKPSRFFSRPTSPCSTSTGGMDSEITPLTIAIPHAETSVEVDLQSPVQALTQPSTPATSRMRLPLTPEQIPLPPSRPGSSRGSYGNILKKRRRKSLDLLQTDEFGVKSPQWSRTQSLRMQSSSLSTISRPTSPRSFAFPAFDPDVRDLPATPESAHNHYVEVKRARKMTQLFGQDLPPELTRILDERRKVEDTRPRADSTPSSIISTSTVTAEDTLDAVREENPTSTADSPRGDFHERRRRVAKLTNFFGVNHAEIASSIIFTKREDQRSGSVSVEGHVEATGVTEPVEIGVKMVSRRLWGLTADTREVDMNDAINKLRSLKSS